MRHNTKENIRRHGTREHHADNTTAARQTTTKTTTKTWTGTTANTETNTDGGARTGVETAGAREGERLNHKRRIICHRYFDPRHVVALEKKCSLCGEQIKDTFTFLARGKATNYGTFVSTIRCVPILKPYCASNGPFSGQLMKHPREGKKRNRA